MSIADSAWIDYGFITIKPIGEDNIRDAYNKLTDEVVVETPFRIQTETVKIKLARFEVTLEPRKSLF